MSLVNIMDLHNNFLNCNEVTTVLIRNAFLQALKNYISESVNTK